jgi:hypothetical protein
MRQNPDGFACAQSGDEDKTCCLHRPVGFADGAAPIPVYRWDFIENLK